MGEAIVADVVLTLAGLAEVAGEAPAGRELPAGRGEAGPLTPPAEGEPLTGSHAMAALAAVWPEDGIVVVETPSSTFALRNRLRLNRPGSYYQSGSGGLGFGIAAAVGVQMAEPDRPVVAVLGEGSAQYAIQALWSAAAYRVPVVFLVLRNQEYAILKWFGMIEQVTGVPGMDLPGLDVAALGGAYGVPSRTVGGDVEELAEALREAICAQDGPRLVQVDVAPGMALE
jgi:benzoylformate decarboxylase